MNLPKPLSWPCFSAILIGFAMGCQPQQKPIQNPATSIVVCGTTATDKAWYNSGQKAMRFDSIGNIHFPISTQKPDVQAYFDQGLMLAVGFNHAEAARSFYEATRLDSTCAMAYWGFAYVLGPNYNAGSDSHFG